MHFIRPLVLFVFLFTQYTLLQAQLLWQYTDSLDLVRRGDRIYSTASGMFVLTDQPTAFNFSNDGKTHLFYLNKGGALQWKQKINLGSPDLEIHAFINEPVLTALDNLAYEKLRAWDDFTSGIALEKFAPDGSSMEIENNYVGVLAPDLYGNIYYLGTTDSGYLLNRYNNDLEVNYLWNSPMYGGTIKPLSDGTFYQYGYLHQPVDGKAFFGARKLTSEGSLIWECFYEPNLLGFVNLDNSTIDTDGNIYLLIRLDGYNELLNHVLLKISAQGTLVWQHPVEGSMIEYSQPEILADDNNNCYLIGTNGVTNYGYYGYINKYSPTGNLVWSQRVGYNNIDITSSAFNEAQLENGNIFVTGSYGWHPDHNLQSPSVVDLLVMKINPESGHVVWKGTFLNTPEYSSEYYVSNALAVKNDSVYITGSTGSNQSPNPEVLVACFTTNTNVNGNLINLIPYLTVDTENTIKLEDQILSIFPNPATDKIFLKTLDRQTTGRLSIFNSHRQQVLAKENVGSNQEINVANLPAGFYSLQWQTNQGVWRSKMIKQ